MNKIAFKTQKLFLDEISIFEQNKLLLEEAHIKKSQSLGLAFLLCKIEKTYHCKYHVSVLHKNVQIRYQSNQEHFFMRERDACASLLIRLQMKN